MSDPNQIDAESDPASGAPEARSAAHKPASAAPGQAAPTDEAPDRDTPAWEGAGPEAAVGLVDPRHEIRTPPGL